MSYNYTQFVTNLANMMPVGSTDPGYTTVLPNIIDDAEQRTYRELDLLNTVSVNTTAALSTGTNQFTLPDTFYIVDRINVITPIGTTDPNAGTRNPVVPATPQVLDFLYPSSSGSTVPQYFGMITQSTVIFGPWPDQTYQVEVVGTVRPAALSSSTVTTLLTQYFPDLFFAASMVFASAYMKNFGAAVDDPQMGVTWETHYKTLLQSAQIEEARKKFTSQAWSSKQPAPLATPARQ